MKPVVVKRHNLEHVFSHNKILYNTNNHEYSSDERFPPDYEERLNMTSTKNWINIFHKDDYQTLTFDGFDLGWMKKALIIGSQTGRCSHIFDDELEITCKKYEHKVPPSEIGWFIRSNRVSLKEGMHGIGPYKNIRQIIESIVTTKVGHFPFQEEDTSCPIYFMRWRNIDPEKEFRVFVYKNEITAVSAQHLYSVNHYLNTLSDEEISVLVNKILLFFETNIKNNLSYLESYTFDFAFVSDGCSRSHDHGSSDGSDIGYFIEPNGFGRHYAAGSALYHWIYDHDTLHESDTIEFRYVSEE